MASMGGGAIGVPGLSSYNAAKDITNAVVWLCSDAASYITGHNLAIDGGFTVQ
jgi:NAD(P)-dependent dehydrogenase (short-subunit alcohol dehydrogenase family)